MAYLKPDKPEKVFVPALREAKEKGEKLVCLTAYDYPTARIVDEAGVDIILSVTAWETSSTGMAIRSP